MTKKDTKVSKKKTTTKKATLKRWWQHQLIHFEGEGEGVLALAEVYWAQEGKKKPRIWYYQEPTISGVTPEEILNMLSDIADTIKDLPVVQEAELPSEEEMDVEYEKVLEENTGCDKASGCGGGCCTH